VREIEIRDELHEVSQLVNYLERKVVKIAYSVSSLGWRYQAQNPVEYMLRICAQTLQTFCLLLLVFKIRSLCSQDWGDTFLRNVSPFADYEALLYRKLCSS
jgi:hypothetical protein